jgi:succinylglutamate desuccinylase
LDLHTTSADGGIYTIVPDHPLAIEFALGIKAPVVLGFLEGLKGTTLHYFTSENFQARPRAFVLKPVSMKTLYRSIEL